MRRFPSLLPSLLGATAIALAACNATPPAAPQPIGQIAPDRFFTGRWYEIARTPMKLTDGCVAGTTDYYRRPTDNQLMDRDACRTGTPTGKEKVYQGPVTITDTASNAKVSVQYTVAGVLPVTRAYWMLDHDPAYQWFIVSNPAFDAVSLFTRNPRPTPSEIQSLTARAKALGYDTGKLEYPTQFPPGQG